MRITPKRKLQKAQAEYSKAKGTHYKHQRAAEKAARGVGDKNAVSPSELGLNVNLADQTRRVLATLTPREEKVLRMRFGIGESGEGTG